jgi:hypothetical protein
LLFSISSYFYAQAPNFFVIQKNNMGFALALQLVLIFILKKRIKTKPMGARVKKE